MCRAYFVVFRPESIASAALRLRKYSIAEQDLLFTEKSFRTNAMCLSPLNQTVRLSNWPRFGRVFNAHYMIEPWLLSHGIYINLLASKAAHNISGLLKVRSCQPAGLVHSPFNLLGQ